MPRRAGRHARPRVSEREESRERRAGSHGLGPGLVAGAADDDPSGIATYSAAGAAYGFGLLWMPLFMVPLMTSVQLMCARVGLVTGRGLAAVLGAWYPRWMLWGACVLLVVANTVNVGADLAGMAESLALVTGGRATWFLVPAAAASFAVLAFGSYRSVAGKLKWLTVVLLAYVATAFLVRPPWREALAAMVRPSVTPDRGLVAMVLAVLGTTISPYLFFWQTSQEVEEEIALGRVSVAARSGATPEELSAARRDVTAGMLYSNGVAFFIMLSTAAVLHRAGVREVRTAAEAAAALRPLAGDAAGLLFALGVVGTGLLGVPVLAGSSAYAVSELLGWREGIGERPGTAPGFFAIVALTLVAGLAVAALGPAVTGVSANRMLFWAAVVNGVLAVPLIGALLVICNDRRVMGDHVNGRAMNVLGATTVAVMGVAAAALLFA
jgi:NRAMP (natural resistance-associated macrophage protein)-like metal ion transporter